VVNGSRPSEARERVFAHWPTEKQLEVIQRAEKRGPRPDDPDWLLVETILDAKAAMERGAMLAPEALAAIKAAIGEPPASGPDAAIGARLDRIEASLRRLETPAAEPEVGIALRDLIVAAITICAMIIVALLMGAGAVSFVTIFAAFLLGLGGAVAYVWLAPMIKRRR
jgi:hypothetical protein